MTEDLTAIKHIIDRARKARRRVLPEPDGLALLDALGLPAPRTRLLPADASPDTDTLRALAGDRVVLKAIAPGMLHKTDVGAVTVIANNVDAVRAAMTEMAGRPGLEHLEGFILQEFIPHDTGFGHEYLLGARWTDDFGPVVVFGAGGVRSEFVAQYMQPGRDTAIFSAGAAPADLAGILTGCAAGEAALAPHRGRPPLVDATRLTAVVQRVQSLAREFMPHDIREFEINPLVVSAGELRALDVLVTLGEGARPASSSRPLHKIKHLLEPRSIAIAGVSTRMNPGRVILENLLRDGFPPRNIHVIKPGADTIAGCACHASITALPQPVDLFVLSIDASQAAGAVTEIIEQRKAESIIIIPGGFEEKDGGMALVERMHAALASARGTDWQGPLINGGNSLGVRSRPGRCDTLFIPGYKLGVDATAESPLAVISQSGAFAISKNSKLRTINPRYTITVGNQMDLTVGDYLEHLKDDDRVETFAVYLEGFQPLDGVRFLAAARDVARRGGTVILYRAGRSAVGARAASSHTAALAGEYRVTRALAERAGVVVAEALADFEDLVMLFSTLRGREVRGRRLGAVSNAGYECVAIADNAADLELPALADDTRQRIQGALQRARLDSVVDIHNPVDLTPIMSEAGYDEVMTAVLADPNVDIGVIGCVPMTPALNTLATSDLHPENVELPDAIAQRIVRLFHDQEKPFVTIVDAGTAYDPMVRILEDNGVPTFRTADRALRLLNMFCAARLRRDFP